MIRAGACIFGLRVEFFDTFFYPLLALLPPATSIVHSGVASIFMFDLLRRPQHYRAGEVNAPFRTVRAANSLPGCLIRAGSYGRALERSASRLHLAVLARPPRICGLRGDGA